MTPLELITARKAHLDRLANRRGAEGERDVHLLMADWTPRPTGARCRSLLSVLAEAGKPIKASAFDALVLPPQVDLDDASSISRQLSEIVFIEIK